MGSVTINGGKNLQAFLSNVAKQKADVKVGFFKDAIYDDGTSIASVAIQNEYGVPAQNIPARPFMRDTVNSNKNKWAKIFGALIKQQKADINITQIFHKLGMLAVGDIQKQIKSGSYVDNAPSTIAKKGFNKPLIDTGVMLKSVNYEVKE